MYTLTPERLRELLHYDPNTGVFVWTARTSNRVRVGDVAGSPDRHGYVVICIDGRSYKAHRLAWLCVHGVWPVAQMDHISGIRSDNRIANLREATHAENQQNYCVRKDSTSGHQGVGWHAARKKWQSRIRVSGRNHHLGYFSDIADAVAARAKAKAAHHTFQPYDRGAK